MRAQEIFVGPIGLRSGWRLLIFLAIVIAFEAAFQEVVVLILKARGIVEPEGLYTMAYKPSGSTMPRAFKISTTTSWKAASKAMTMARKISRRQPERSPIGPTKISCARIEGHTSATRYDSAGECGLPPRAAAATVLSRRTGRRSQAAPCSMREPTCSHFKRSHALAVTDMCDRLTST